MSKTSVGLAAGLLLLTVRGVLLWLVIPIGTLIWMVTFQWAGAGRVSLGCFLGWLDNNLAYALQRGPLRPLFPSPTVSWIRSSHKSGVTHRLRAIDLF